MRASFLCSLLEILYEFSFSVLKRVLKDLWIGVQSLGKISWTVSDLWTLRQIDTTRTKVCISELGPIWLTFEINSEDKTSNVCYVIDKSRISTFALASPKSQSH